MVQVGSKHNRRGTQNTKGGDVLFYGRDHHKVVRLGGEDLALQAHCCTQGGLTQQLHFDHSCELGGRVGAGDGRYSGHRLKKRCL